MTWRCSGCLQGIAIVDDKIVEHWIPAPHRTWIRLWPLNVDKKAVDIYFVCSWSGARVVWR